jgi:hypothetical protein
MFKAKVGQTLMMGFLMAILFRNIDYIDDNGRPIQTGVQDLVGSLFFVCVNQIMMNMMATVTIFCDERPVFLREQANKMYGVGPYYMTKVMVDMPANFIFPMLLSLMLYWTIGLSNTVE